MHESGELDEGFVLNYCHGQLFQALNRNSLASSDAIIEGYNDQKNQLCCNWIRENGALVS